ncbi:MAG TPA: hypothetical protein VFN10_15425 [Thermoanaerobaculia bacterium]|nr:hypothetical protein [Thermoanaerobaculia bacterium]
MLTTILLTAFVCGTSPAQTQRATELDRFVHLTRPRIEAQEASTTRVVDDVIYVRADAETTPFDDPADLEGMSLRFTRKDAVTFTATREPLQYDEATGPLLGTFGRGEITKPLALPFAFPFGNAQYHDAWISVARGIHFSESPALFQNFFDALDLLASDAPLISPLYDFQDSMGSRPSVFVKSSASAVTITMRREFSDRIDFDLQVTLFASGDILFAYKKVRGISWGGVVVRTGDPAWRAQRTLLGQTDDPADDLDPAYGAERPMLDLRSVQVSRLANSSLLEVRLRTAGAIDVNVLKDGASYTVYLLDSVNRLELVAQRGHFVYRVTNATERTDTPLARVNGKEITMLVDESQLALKDDRNISIWAYSNSFSTADSATTTFNLGPIAPPLETDFSTLTSIETARPLVETYHLPTVNVNGVWDRIHRDLGLREEEIDAVAIYTSFLSDIILTPYGAWATGGNPGVDGIAPHASTTNPRTPSLMHMNSLDTFSGESATRILMHEMGHRWLYYFAIEENGAPSRSLNPVSPHPAQFVQTSSAFGNDTSAMGGGAFSDNHDGTFSTPQSQLLMGFSWHELYLMGLARPEEVQPWFYLRNTQLGGEYNAPLGITVNGARTDVSLQQLIAENGPRKPGFDASQKEFRVVFVVIEREGQPVTDMPELRAPFEAAFAAATGGRGSIRTNVFPAKTSGKRRAVH